MALTSVALTYSFIHAEAIYMSKCLAGRTAPSIIASGRRITIGLYAVASGIFTVFMPPPKIAGSSVVRQYLEQDVAAETGGRFLFTDDIDEAAEALIAHLDEKRATLWASGTSKDRFHCTSC